MDHITPAVMVVRPSMNAGSLVRGSVITERTERGKVSCTAVVRETGPCTDPGNVHVSVDVKRAGKSAGHHVWCYLRNAAVEAV